MQELHERNLCMHNIHEIRVKMFDMVSNSCYNTLSCVKRHFIWNVLGMERWNEIEEDGIISVS